MPWSGAIVVTKCHMIHTSRRPVWNLTFIESKEEDTKPRQVEDTTSEGWNTRRFLLTFDFKYYDRVMAQDFWPQQIYYKRWFTRKQNNTIHGEG